MAEIVINACFGGFSLSRKAVARMAELQGRECYFFTTNYAEGDDRYVPAPKPGEGRDLFWTAFDIPNPNEVLALPKPWHQMTLEERQAHDDVYEAHDLTNRPEDRSDPLLLRVVKELGKEANGGCAELKIVEVPDDAEWEISEYDGLEHVAEKHRVWS